MAPNISGIVRGRSTIEAATQATVFNETVALANTEQSVTLPNNTKTFEIRVRDASAKLQFAFNTGETNTTYFTLRRGQSYEATGLDFTGDLYFEASTTCVVEIIAWH